MNKHIITLLLVCSTYASAAMPADGISTPLITNESGEVVQRVEYLPTGETFIEQQDTSWVSPHKFNGRSALRDAFETTWRKKELDKMHGLDWYDSSARYYDHVLGRFHQIDPLAEKYYSWSPYAYRKYHDNSTLRTNKPYSNIWIMGRL